MVGSEKNGVVSLCKIVFSPNSVCFVFFNFKFLGCFFLLYANFTIGDMMFTEFAKQQIT